MIYPVNDEYSRLKRKLVESRDWVMSDLEIAEPYFGVKHREREYVVDEGLGSPSLRRYAEYLYPYITEHCLLRRDLRRERDTYVGKQFFRQPSPFRFLERSVEAQ